MSGLRLRSRQLKLGAAGLVAALLVVGIATGIVSGEPSAEPAAQNFLLAWAQGQYKEAAALTTGPPGPVTVALRTAYQQLGAAAYYLSMGQVSQHSGVATAYFHASVDLGQDGAAWDYSGHFTLRKLSGSWKVVWSPAVINPGLRQGVRMAVVTRMPNRAPVLDAGGGSLIRPSAAWIAQVRPGDLKDPQVTATAFAAATGLDEEQVLSVIRAAPQSAPLNLLTLRPSIYQKLRHKLARVPGLTMLQRSRRLFSSVASDVTGSVGTEIAPALQEQGISYRPGTTVGVSGLQEVYQRMLAGTPQTMIVAENAAGHQVAVLKKWDGEPGTPVRTTIDGGVQTAADRALAGQSSAGAIIAVQASSGHILAVANRNADRRAEDRPAERAVPARERVHYRVHRRAAVRWPAVAGHADPVPVQHQRGRPHVQQRAGHAPAGRGAAVQQRFRAVLRDRVHHPVARADRIPAGQQRLELRARPELEAAAERVHRVVPGRGDPGRPGREHRRPAGRRGQPAGHGPGGGRCGRGHLAPAGAGHLAARPWAEPARGGRRADRDGTAPADAGGGDQRRREVGQPGRRRGVRPGRYRPDRPRAASGGRTGSSATAAAWPSPCCS